MLNPSVVRPQIKITQCASVTSIGTKNDFIINRKNAEDICRNGVNNDKRLVVLGKGGFGTVVRGVFKASSVNFCANQEHNDSEPVKIKVNKTEVKKKPKDNSKGKGRQKIAKQYLSSSSEDTETEVKLIDSDDDMDRDKEDAVLFIMTQEEKNG
ncbi:unnamed protein product [Acanthoscelides obtectus]|nr:unnamed protein product [Acanthoscelides obtectus]CAK1632329.1 hypothetical protein AOBTE_LOCUS7486 [Acanthoscelides obtectus]